MTFWSCAEVSNSIFTLFLNQQDSAPLNFGASWGKVKDRPAICVVKCASPVQIMCSSKELQVYLRCMLLMFPIPYRKHMAMEDRKRAADCKKGEKWGSSNIAVTYVMTVQLWSTWILKYADIQVQRLLPTLKWYWVYWLGQANAGYVFWNSQMNTLG